MQPLLTLYDTGNIQRKLLIRYRRFPSQNKNVLQQDVYRPQQQQSGVCLGACWDSSPLGVGLETPWPDPPQLPHWVWAWRPRLARSPSTSPLGVGLCKNITLPQTSLAGGNYQIFHFQIFELMHKLIFITFQICTICSVTRIRSQIYISDYIVITCIYQ